MEYTQNYQLPLWDKEDAVLRTDFNENNQKIDAAIAAVKTEASNALTNYKTTNDAAVSTKAEQSAVNALSVAVENGIKFQSGTYAGTGVYGESDPTTLNFAFPPKFVMVWCDSAPHVLLALCDSKVTVRYDNTAWVSATTWGAQSVSWHSTTSARNQMNEASKNYHYIALG